MNNSNKKLLLLKFISMVNNILIPSISGALIFAYDAIRVFPKFTSDNMMAIFNTFIPTTIVIIILIDAFHLNMFQFVSTLNIFRRTVHFSISYSFVISSFAFYFRQFSYPRSAILYGTIITMLWLFFSGILFRNIYLKISDKKSILIIGKTDETITDLCKKISMHKNEFNISDIVTRHIEEIKFGNEWTINESAIVIGPDIDDELRFRLLSIGSNQRKRIFISPSILDLSIKSSRFIQFNDLLMFSAPDSRLNFEQRLLKRVFDIIFSLFILIFTSPILLFISLIIKLTSKGSVIFKQERVTKDFKTFEIYKFRTMFNDAEKLTGPVISSQNDERVTPFGKLLRRTRLDELPQFVNVLSGEMSIVGPRAERMVFIETFLKTVPGYHLRYNVKAGITGYAQIFGNYDSSAENKLKFDLSYINNYTLLMDIRLILMTIQKVIA